MATRRFHAAPFLRHGPHFIRVADIVTVTQLDDGEVNILVGGHFYAAPNDIDKVMATITGFTSVEEAA